MGKRWGDVTPPVDAVPTGRPQLSDVVSLGDHRNSLLAMRDQLADEAADARRADHKAECHCVCGIGDARALVAVFKELRTVLTEIAELPDAGEVSDLDEIRRRRAARRDAAQ